MSEAIDLSTIDPQPFFKDPRTLAQRLAVERREWRPHQSEHNCPACIFGLVLERDTFFDKQGKPCPTLRILDDDLKTEWSVIAFHGWLRGGIERQDPRVGDYVLLVFKGTGKAKPGESEPYLYEVLVERDPEQPYLSGQAAAAQPAPEPAAAPDSDFSPADEDVPF